MAVNWWQRQKAEKVRRQLCYAVLRPVNRKRVAEYLKDLRARLDAGLPSEQFQNEMHEQLGPRCIFAGFLRAGDKRLYSADGAPTGDTVQSGDVLDELPEFEKACAAGVYQKAETTPDSPRKA